MCVNGPKHGVAKTRLERMQAWRSYEYASHYEKDLKSTAFNLSKCGGIMFAIRAERVARLDSIIERLKCRAQRTGAPTE